MLQKIVMPAGYVSTMMKSMKEAGMIRYDFNAMQTYKYSMTQYDREGTIMLPLQNSRAKAMLCCPINATSYATSGAIDQTVGYGFQIELTWRALRAGLRVVEVPITFVDRVAGHSKMSAGIFVEALGLVWRLRWRG